MSEHQNTHPITPDCKTMGLYVLGSVEGRVMVGVTFGHGGWKPARMAGAADLKYFGEQPSRGEKQ